MALLAIDIMNEPRWGVCDTVATGLLKVNPDFFSIKTQKTQIENYVQTSKYLQN